MGNVGARGVNSTLQGDLTHIGGENLIPILEMVDHEVDPLFNSVIGPVFERTNSFGQSATKFNKTCFTCRKECKEKKAIYMYNDMPFCSFKCRHKKMEKDEQEEMKKQSEMDKKKSDEEDENKKKKIRKNPSPNKNDDKSIFFICDD